jgi:hypothetical protein
MAKPDLPEPRQHNGVTYSPRWNSATYLAIVWDGGPVGGVFHEVVHRVGDGPLAPRFGWLADWHLTWESAAEIAQTASRNAYENAKGVVTAFEAAQPDDFEGLHYTAYAAGHEAADRYAPFTPGWLEFRAKLASGEKE